jgi:serpin B
MTPLAAAALAGLSGIRPSDLTLPARSRELVGDTTSSVDSATCDAAAQAIRGFSADFYRELVLTTPQASNSVCSPYSIAVALAMTRAGARGATASEMDTVLHAPTPAPQALDSGLNALEQVMISQYRDHDDDGGKQPRLAVANSLWPRLRLSLEPAFLETLAHWYGARPHPVDFASDPEAARKEINAWISDHTFGKIPELLRPGLLGPQVALVLANALYLKASWKIAFDPKATQLAPFTRDDGRIVAAPLMSAQPELLGYQETKAFKAVNLPYVGSRLAMAVIIPTEGSLRALESTISGPWLTSLLRGFRNTPVAVRLPRWTFRLPADVGQLLAGLGMPTAFTARADFSGITRQVPLCIDRVVHETFVTVDEKGTEAAAATAVIVKENGVPNPKSVVADRSFLYVIHDVPTATPLFLGRVVDPTLTRV